MSPSGIVVQTQEASLLSLSERSIHDRNLTERSPGSVPSQDAGSQAERTISISANTSGDSGTMAGPAGGSILGSASLSLPISLGSAGKIHPSSKSLALGLRAR